jgi:hypothetical protein
MKDARKDKQEENPGLRRWSRRLRLLGSGGRRSGPRTESAPSPTVRASILAAMESPACSTERLSGCELSAVGARRHPTVVLKAVRYALPSRLNSIHHQSGLTRAHYGIGLAVGVNVDQFGCGNNLRGARAFRNCGRKRRHTRP